jgi:hypothetical protein
MIKPPLRVSSSIEEVMVERLTRRLLAAYRARDKEAIHALFGELEELLAFIDREVGLGLPTHETLGKPQ